MKKTNIIKRNQEAKKRESEQKENEKKDVKIPGSRLIESLKRDRRDLTVKENKIKIDENIQDGSGKSDKLKEKREKLERSIEIIIKGAKRNLIIIIVMFKFYFIFTITTAEACCVAVNIGQSGTRCERMSNC